MLFQSLVLAIITPKCLDSLSAAWLSEWFSHPDCWVSYILHAWIELAWKKTDLSQLYHNCIANRHHNQNHATPTNRPTGPTNPKNPPKKSTLLAPFKTTLSQPTENNQTHHHFSHWAPGTSGRGLLSSTGQGQNFRTTKKGNGSQRWDDACLLGFFLKTCTLSRGFRLEKFVWFSVCYRFCAMESKNFKKKWMEIGWIRWLHPPHLKQILVGSISMGKIWMDCFQLGPNQKSSNHLLQSTQMTKKKRKKMA